jgi:hypothetical protein
MRFLFDIGIASLSESRWSEAKADQAVKPLRLDSRRNGPSYVPSENKVSRPCPNEFDHSLVKFFFALQRVEFVVQVGEVGCKIIQLIDAFLSIKRWFPAEPLCKLLKDVCKLRQGQFIDAFEGVFPNNPSRIRAKLAVPAIFNFAAIPE